MYHEMQKYFNANTLIAQFNQKITITLLKYTIYLYNSAKYEFRGI